MKFGLTIFSLVLLYTCTTIPDDIDGIGNKIEVTTLMPESIKGSSVILIGTINQSDITEIKSKGFFVNKTGNPNTNSSTTINTGNDLSSFRTNLEGLETETKYYSRAFVLTKGNIVIYGNVISFITKSPTINITTTPASSINENSATSGGILNIDAGGTIITGGICWSKDVQVPTIYNDRTFDGTGNGTFQSKITGLFPNTKYYYRAYCSLSTGQTFYGNVLSFTTPGPQISITSKVIEIYESGAKFETTYSSSVSLIERGICYSTNPSPTINQNKISFSGTNSNYTYTLNVLNPNTQYYLIGYALDINRKPYYGNEIPFRTKITQQQNVPILLSPVNGATIRATKIEFNWSTIPNTTYYVLLVSTNKDFPLTSTFQTLYKCNGNEIPKTLTNWTNYMTTTSNSFCMDGSTNTTNIQFFWKVRSVIGENRGSWSPTYSFNYRR